MLDFKINQKKENKKQTDLAEEIGVSEQIMGEIMKIQNSFWQKKRRTTINRASF